MEKYSDNIFDKLYSKEDAALWYKARHFVMNVLAPLDRDGIGCSSSKHVHVVVDSIGKEMLAVVRQICLIAHYPNFNEVTGNNKTIITFCLGKGKDIDEEEICAEMDKSLGNFHKFINYSINGSEPKNLSKNKYLPLDIEFEFVNKSFTEVEKKGDEFFVPITKDEVETEFSAFTKDNYNIDVTNGMLVNMVYNTGATIDNLSACDNANIERYSIALDVFCYKLKVEEIEKKWNDCAKPNEDGTYNALDIKNQLSSIFCADCFESRLKGLLDTKKKSVAEYLLCDFDTVMKNLCEEKTINALVRCEHARWNVEKLIMGFSPLTETDWYDIECCFEAERDNKIRELKKKDFRHIDLCSYQNLRRVDPGNMKYDYFLMLAMPQIVLATFQ